MEIECFLLDMLIKNLIVKKDSKNNKWYKIFFPGKKSIIKWMRSYNISYLSVNSEFLTR